ncbi:curli production assembly/transport protein CsgE [Alcaligenes faecalis]|uniref:curli production assembly/transport protein CsgE n=1 Tax=Alcaligenes faecalis TaxID=511 RepID=UPI002933A0C0|nr:curli production assembly/transport protein CsgE [Alcaligenes faecalis]MDV2116764.1 curli production assembly/transport protein CsgE [Alcaligenes faecalis]
MTKPYQQGAVLLAMLCVMGSAAAQPGRDTGKPKPANFMEAIRQAEVVRKNLFDDPLSGIVINRTVTVQGQDFYRYFSNRWRELSGASSFTLTVVERPSARWGSEIWVEYRRQRMYHAFLTPARSGTKKASERAVDLVLENVSKSEIERVLINNPDLAPDEL